ncbi:hypothetical protein QCA50_007726 [Cerrena zonata]|uniref:DUF6534 domain-containing protein n=1 Tax=Cerrena zonata TaxID=2478898 RepID=A0AAW0GJ38_9APHY
MTSFLPSISYFLAPFLQAIAVGGILYGTSLLQVYYYLINCDREPTWTKLFVALVFIIETISTALSFVALNAYTIKVMENPSSLLILDWHVLRQFTPLRSQHRSNSSDKVINRHMPVHKCQDNRSFAQLLYWSNVDIHEKQISDWTGRDPVGFAFAQHQICSAGTWISIRFDHRTKVATLVAMTSAPIADAITALSVATTLYRSLPKIRRMRQIITYLLVMTINTGFILVAVGLCTLITFLKMSESITWAGTLLLSGKLYANSLFAMLNGRLALRSRLNNPIVRSDDLMLPSISRAQSAIQKPVHVHISREVYSTDVINIEAEPIQFKGVDTPEGSVV